MQKVIRRTMLAERQAARRNAKRDDIQYRQRRKNDLEQARFHRRQEVKGFKAAKLALREDWELGPLAPKRDVGDQAEIYGTIDSSIMKRPVLPMKERLEQLKFVGGRGYSLIGKGDRVAILHGREKGKIGKIMEMDKERGECKIEGMNMIDIELPGWMQMNDHPLDRRRLHSEEQPIPFSWIRLVARITNEETGEVEDVVCKKVEIDRPGSGNRFVRMSDGTKVFIPRPRIEGREKSEHKAHPADTERLEVEQKTYVPTLLRPPIPGSVIDELRNKYSIFRTRHDPEYIAAKMKEDEEKKEKEMAIKKMRTPLKEINRLERKLKRAKGKGKLTEEMLEKIGKVIAQKRQLQLDVAAGISKEPEILAA